VAAASWLVAEYLSRIDDVAQRPGFWQPHNRNLFSYVNTITYE